MSHKVPMPMVDIFWFLDHGNTKGRGACCFVLEPVWLSNCFFIDGIFLHSLKIYFIQVVVSKQQRDPFQWRNIRLNLIWKLGLSAEKSLISAVRCKKSESKEAFNILSSLSLPPSLVRWSNKGNWGLLRHMMPTWPGKKTQLYFLSFFLCVYACRIIVFCI